MRATVTYNDEYERTGFKVNTERAVGLTANFNMDGTTAVLMEVKPEGEYVYADHLTHVLDYAADLPFVQGVTIDGFEPSEEET